MKSSRHLVCWISAAALAAAAFPLSADPLLSGDDDVRESAALEAALQSSAKTFLSTGELAPLFSGRDQDGHKWKLSHHLGKNVVLLYFYPKDDTARGTAEAGNVRDNLVELKQMGVVVVGVSSEGKRSHKEFAFRNNLSFPLLTDTGGHIAEAYGVRMGEEIKMDRRLSFLIGLDGTIIHITDSPDPVVHLREMMAAAAKLAGKIAL